MHNLFPHALQFVAMFATLVAAVTDARSGIIPNRLTLPLLVAAPLAHLLIGGPGALLAAVVGAGVCGLVPLLLFAMGALGGGDLKVLAALGALLGPTLGMRVQLAGFIAAAALALVQLAWRRRLITTLLASARLVFVGFLPRSRRPRTPTREATTLRFGPPLCAATALVLTLEHLA